MCSGDDELGHIQMCPHYETKWEDTFWEDSILLSTYLVSVDREWRWCWKRECLF